MACLNAMGRLHFQIHFQCCSADPQVSFGGQLDNYVFGIISSAQVFMARHTLIPISLSKQEFKISGIYK